MHVRKLEPPDREAVAALLRSDDTFREDEVEVALELVDDALARPDRDYRVLVCEDEGRVLGYICYGKTPMTAATFDLYWVATHVAARGRGIARRLMNAMEDEILRLGGSIVRLETSQTEAYGAARGFYERASYREVGRIEDFYMPGDDLLIFAKRLQAEAQAARGASVKVA